MMKLISIQKKKHTDIDYLVAIIENNDSIITEFYESWYQYFMDHYQKTFFGLNKVEITYTIHDAFVRFHNNVRHQKIKLKDGIIVGRNDEPFSSKFTTYLMDIACNIRRENLRDAKKHVLIDDLYHFSKVKKLDDNDKDSALNSISAPIEYSPYLYTDYEQEMREIVSNIISNMSSQCNKILTMYYYEEKKLDNIFEELDNVKSKNALKTEKYKCLEKLKVKARDEYQRIFNM